MQYVQHNDATIAICHPFQDDEYEDGSSDEDDEDYDESSDDDDDDDCDDCDDCDDVETGNDVIRSGRRPDTDDEDDEDEGHAEGRQRLEWDHDIQSHQKLFLNRTMQPNKQEEKQDHQELKSQSMSHSQQKFVRVEA